MGIIVGAVLQAVNAMTAVRETARGMNRKWVMTDSWLGGEKVERGVR